MHAVVKQYIEINYILAGTDKYISGRDLRKVGGKPLCSRAHTGRRNGSNEEYVSDPAELLYELNSARVKRLGRDKIRG